MKSYMELSEHDQKLLDKIAQLDEGGYVNWVYILDLSEQLHDEEYRKYWHNVCVRYNHIEEASMGLL